MFEGRVWRSGAFLLMLALAAAACGSSSDSTTTTLGETTSTRDSRPDRNSTTTVPESTTSTGATTTTAEPTSSPEPAPAVGSGPVGVVGCSNTDLSVAGYTDVSALDRLTTGDLGGGAPPLWGDPSEDTYAVYWANYDSRRPATGYVETWVQLCLRVGDHNGSFDADEQEWITHIVEQVHLRDPGIPVWVSPINSYEGVVCESIGPDGPAIAAEASDWAAAELADVFRGPDLGPLTEAEVGLRDNCHPNQSGQRLLGEQLVAFFD